MLRVLSETVEGNMNIVKYTEDGETVAAVVKSPIPIPQPEVKQKGETGPTLEERVQAVEETITALLGL